MATDGTERAEKALKRYEKCHAAPFVLSGSDEWPTIDAIRQSPPLTTDELPPVKKIADTRIDTCIKTDEYEIKVDRPLTTGVKHYLLGRVNPGVSDLDGVLTFNWIVGTPRLRGELDCYYRIQGTLSTTRSYPICPVDEMAGALAASYADAHSYSKHGRLPVGRVTAGRLDQIQNRRQLERDIWSVLVTTGVVEPDMVPAGIEPDMDTVQHTRRYMLLGAIYESVNRASPGYVVERGEFAQADVIEAVYSRLGVSVRWGNV